jgi:hypothetical protein
MLWHTCKPDDMKIIGQRVNPLDASWSEWTLVVCCKCKKLLELQHHSEEAMHGGDLEVTALPRKDYVKLMYGVVPDEIDEILSGSKKIRRYDRYKKAYVEEYA